MDANASKKHLVELAKRLGVSGRTRMSKDELVEALHKANDRETAPGPASADAAVEAGASTRRAAFPERAAQVGPAP